MGNFAAASPLRQPNSMIPLYVLLLISHEIHGVQTINNTVFTVYNLTSSLTAILFNEPGSLTGTPSRAITTSTPGCTVSNDRPSHNQWGKIWADMLEVWIGGCERQRVMRWESDAGCELQIWLEWVSSVRYD